MIILLCIIMPLDALANPPVSVRVYPRFGPVGRLPYRVTTQFWTVAPARPPAPTVRPAVDSTTMVNRLGQRWNVVSRPIPPELTTTPYDESLLNLGQSTDHSFRSGTPPYRVRRTVRVIATAYNSRRNQTDATPWRTASNRLVRDGDIACNFLPLGTLVRIVDGPDIVRGKIFRVEDRLANPPPLGWNQIDIWMLHYRDAVAFKKQKLTLQVLDDPLGEAPH